MMTNPDRDTIERALRLRRLMNEFLLTRSPQERDRTMQVHLAQARGPVHNAMLLRQMTSTFVRLRRTQKSMEPSDD